MNSASQKRKNVRPQLFSGKNREPPHNDLDEEEWLLPNWEVYVKLNLELPDPGPDGAVRELRKMVETRKTPDYKGGKKGGNGKPIPPRDLGDLDSVKLEELLPIY